jgi:hypothetical protein
VLWVLILQKGPCEGSRQLEPPATSGGEMHGQQGCNATDLGNLSKMLATAGRGNDVDGCQPDDLFWG